MTLVNFRAPHRYGLHSNERMEILALRLTIVDKNRFHYTYNVEQTRTIKTLADHVSVRAEG